MKLKHLWITLLALMISACSSVPNASYKDYMPKGSSVAVFAAYPDKLQLVNIGLTVFNNEFSQTDIPEWNLSNAIRKEASDQLSRQGYLKVVDVPHDARELIRALHESDARASLLEKIQSITKDQHIDAAVVFYPSSTQDPFFGTNVNISDYGIYCRTAFGAGTCMTYSVGSYVLFDLRTGSKFKAGFSTDGEQAPGISWPVSDAASATSRIEDNIKKGITKDVVSIGNKLKQQAIIHSNLNK